MGRDDWVGHGQSAGALTACKFSWRYPSYMIIFLPAQREGKLSQQYLRDGGLVRKFKYQSVPTFCKCEGGFGEEIYLGSLSRHFVKLRGEGGLVRKFS